MQSCSLGKFGWRGGFLSGKLFFNRNTTRKNIDLMQKVLNIIDDQEFNKNEKVNAISLIRKKLSRGGRANELLITFLKIT